MEIFGTDMYDRKYANKDETEPRSIVTYFIDKYLSKGKNCLDLGSGAGRHSKYIAEKGIDVIAVDLSEVGLGKTREALRKFPNSKVLIADIHDLPFKDGSFDSIFCNRVLDYNDDDGLEIAFTEIERVVRNSGIILITVRSTSQSPKAEENLIAENDQKGKSFKVGDSTQIQHYFTEQEIQALANKHSFQVIEIRENKHTNSEHELKAEWQAILKKLE